MKRIVLVDDDNGILDAVTMILSRAGYAVDTFLKGESLIDDQFTEPDLFIIDKQLSGIDGLDLCKFLKQRTPLRNTPIIIFSASPHVSKIALNAGADDFLEKPFKSASLLEMVNKHLHNSAR
ncbi:MAG: response regulator [Pedobacter sp.]|nr:MAG: response regulator [Pedobacter sp.]